MKRDIIQEHTVAKRRVLRAAFDAIRHDKSQSAVAAKLAKALGGSGPLTDALYAEAADLCILHENADLVGRAAALGEMKTRYRRSMRYRAARKLMAADDR